MVGGCSVGVGDAKSHRSVKVSKLGLVAVIALAAGALSIGLSYAVGLWPTDTGAPIYANGSAVPPSWADRLERFATAGILIGGVVALGVATWRARSADQQANAAQEQVNTALQQVTTAQRQVESAQRQADTAYQGLLNERYQKGAEMLGSEILAVRMAGIYALGQLGEDHPDQYYVQIMKLLCTFVRHPGEPDVPRVYEGDSARVDVSEAVAWIGSHRNHRVEKDAEYTLDLCEVNLRNANLTEADLSFTEMDYVRLRGALLYKVSFEGANMFRADFSSYSDDYSPRLDSVEAAEIDGGIYEIHRVDFTQTDLQSADFAGVTIIDAKFDDARLSGCILSGADLSKFHEKENTGLTQDQVNQAYWYGIEPAFTGTLDKDTGEQIQIPNDRSSGM